MMSQTGKYALRILGFLVDRPNERVQGDQIAQATGIPANYLSKILNQLRKRGLVESQKGWGGGFTLAKGAPKIPIATVIEVFDGKKSEQACIFNVSACDPLHPCPLHSDWERIATAYDHLLSSTKIADLHAPRKAHRHD